MNKKTLKLTLVLLFIMKISYSQSDVGNQFLKNIRLSYGYEKTDYYRWSRISVGTGYGERFKKMPRAYWYTGASLNYGTYRFNGYNDKLTTTSISAPIHLGYDLLRTEYFAMNVYVGPQFEYIFYVSDNNFASNQINRFQAGLSVGTTVRLARFIGLRVGYTYYPTKAFRHYDYTRSSFGISFGF